MADPGSFAVCREIVTRLRPPKAATPHTPDGCGVADPAGWARCGPTGAARARSRRWRNRRALARPTTCSSAACLPGAANGRGAPRRSRPLPRRASKPRPMGTARVRLHSRPLTCEVAPALIPAQMRPGAVLPDVGSRWSGHCSSLSPSNLTPAASRSRLSSRVVGRAGIGRTVRAAGPNESRWSWAGGISQCAASGGVTDPRRLLQSA